MGPNPSDCNDCSLSENNECVNGCSDSTYFIRNSTRTCEKCHTLCGNGGCTESGLQNCLKQNTFAAGSGTTAIFTTIIIILAIVITLLVVFIVLRVQYGSSINHNFYFSSPFKRVGNTVVGDNNAKYTKTSQLQDIPLTSKDIALQSMEDKSLSEGIGLCSEMNAENKEAQEPTSGKEISEKKPEEYSLPFKINLGSQGMYTDVENLTPLEIPARKHVYTDVELEEPSILHRAVNIAPFHPPLPAFTINKKSPVPDKTDALPELDTDIKQDITEVFINREATEYIYDDASAPPKSSTLPPPSSVQVLKDSPYEDTDNALAMMELYRKSSSTERINTIQFLAKSSGMGQLISRQSVPALPSGPIPKKRLNTSLPQTPLQKSLSHSSNMTAHTPPTHTQSVTSIPQEESLYEDISG